MDILCWWSTCCLTHLNPQTQTFRCSSVWSNRRSLTIISIKLLHWTSASADDIKAICCIKHTLGCSLWVALIKLWEREAEELCSSVPATQRASEHERGCRIHYCCRTTLEAERERAWETGISVEGREGRREDGTAAVWASSLLARLLKVIIELLTRDSLHPSIHLSIHNRQRRTRDGTSTELNWLVIRKEKMDCSNITTINDELIF